MAIGVSQMWPCTHVFCSSKEVVQDCSVHSTFVAGWLKRSRKQVTDNLFKIVKQLRQEHAVARGGSALQIVAGAKIPIVKVPTDH